MAFDVAPFRERDFRLEWRSVPPADVSVELLPGSLTWVRVSSSFVLPRARVRVSAPGAKAVELRLGELRQRVSAQGGEAGVALFSGEFENEGQTPHELVVVREGQTETHAFDFRFSPSPERPLSGGSAKIFVDGSCSRYRVLVRRVEKFPAQHWAYLGCRMIYSRARHDWVPQLQVQVAWHGPSGLVSVGGVPREVTGPREGRSVALDLHLDHRTPSVQLEDESGAGFEIAAPISPSLKLAFLGLGLGPYAYEISVPGMPDVRQTAPIATLYGSYLLSETSRVIFFDAFPIHRAWYNDFGLYFNSESIKALDDRISFNLLLGFHLISFESPIGVQHRLGAPQGFEMILRDAFGRRNNVTLGGFFYPPIDGKAYTNSWLRVGGPKFFAEINYLSWTEQDGSGGSASSNAFGLSIGAPLIFF